MSIDDSTWSQVRQMREQLARIEDNHTRTMTQAWVNAWDAAADDLDAALNELALEAGDGRIKRSTVIKSERLRKALTVIETKLNGLFEASGQLAIDHLDDIVNNAGIGQTAMIGSQLPPSERAMVNAWSTVSAGQITAIVERASEQITKLSYPLSDQATASMRRELVRGMVNGSNPREAARLMLKRTEGLFNGGLSRAMTIARTEMLDAQRAAAALTEQANTNILAGWVWSASLSARTCPSCWAMDGQEFPLDQSGPDDHQSGRCTRVTKTKSWKELGFDLPEPPSLMPDAAATFNALPKVDQLQVLGPGRYQAWKAGDFPMDKWATKRINPGWRDSYVTAKVPA